MKKESIGCVIPVVLLGGLFVWNYYRNAEKREEREARERERTTEVESREAEETRRVERVYQTFQDLAKRHNAAIDCPGVPQTQFGDGFYTLELQDALQKHGDKAIFLCRVDDVFKMGDGFHIVTRYMNDFGGRDMTFLLEVDEATARHLVAEYKPDHFFGQAFAVAVVVKRVTVTLTREYYGVGEIVEAGTYESDQETEVEILEKGGMFPQIVISGKCLEIIPLEGETVF
jgi:hypothetical protein